MTSRPSEAARLGGAAAPAVGLLVAALCVTAVAPLPADAQVPPPAEIRLDGEYGLWVSERDGRLQVRWITAERSRGALEARAAGRRIHRVRTSSGRAHHADFRLPRGADSVLLRYGAAGSDAETHETTIWLPLDPPRAGAVFAAPDSVFVVGDVHGHFTEMRRLLAHAGLVDGEGRWTGGRARLVLLGDLVDRGWDVTRTLWWLYGLEASARAAGGEVHVVLGNHEAMVWTDDLRYVQSKELEVARLHGVPYPRLFDVRTSVLGRWLATKPPVLLLGDLLLAHGGVGGSYRDWSVQAFDDSLAAFVREPLFHRWSDSTVTVPPMDSAALWRRVDFFMGEESPFWHRGWLPPAAYRTSTAGGGEATAAAETPPDSLTAALDALLRRYGASRHVVAHTPLERVTSFFDGRLLATDLNRPATELLLLVRDGDGWRPYRWPTGGEPVPLE